MMKSCKEMYQYICSNLDEDLSSPGCKDIKKHLDSCTDCQAYLDSLKKTVVLYRTLPAPDLPRTAHARVLKAIQLEFSAAHPRKKHRRTPTRKKS
ncbi:MAG: hypothetical protein KAJ12_00295 [Bacteroidetes bacterium]|nr:hypothetical protein [Bacteroidota bacterium]